MLFTDADKANEWIRDWRSTTSHARNAHARRAFRSTAYYLGHQLLRTNNRGYNFYVDNNGVKRLNDMDARNLRTQINRVTRNTLMSAAATHPRKMMVEAKPSHGNTTQEGQALAAVLEIVTNLGVKTSGLLAAAQDANFKRCLWGDCGIGVDVRMGGMYQVEGEIVPDLSLHAYTFRYDQLSLDPANHSRNLDDHEWVLYTEAMTRDRIARVYGVQLEDEQCRKLGELRGTERAFSGVTGGEIFNQYEQYSKTLGALVHFVHCREGRRWPTMQVFIETSGDKREMIPGANTLQDPRTPYGADALPYRVLRGHRRGEDASSIGDTGMMLDDQDRLNVMATILLQNLRNFTGPKMVVDSRWFGPNYSDEDVKKKLTTTPYGIIAGKASMGASPPQYLAPPPPPTYIESMIRMTEDDVRNQGFRGPHHEGITKSHVTQDAANRTMDESNQVLDQRGEDDVEQYNGLLRVICGTVVKHAKMGSPHVLAALADEGLSEDDFEMLARTNERNPPVVLTVTGQTMRYRSRAERAAQVQSMLMAQALAPEEARRILADELDMPLSDDDVAVGRMVTENAMAVANGEPWQPTVMGMRIGQRQIEAFQRAMLDRKARQNPEVLARLSQAADAQRAIEMAAIQAQATRSPNGSQQAGGDPTGMVDLASLIPPMPGSQPVA